MHYALIKVLRVDKSVVLKLLIKAFIEHSVYLCVFCVLKSLTTESRHDANFVVTGVSTNDDKVGIMTTMGFKLWLFLLGITVHASVDRVIIGLDIGLAPTRRKVVIHTNDVYHPNTKTNIILMKFPTMIVIELVILTTNTTPAKHWPAYVIAMAAYGLALKRRQAISNHHAEYDCIEHIA